MQRIRFIIPLLLFVWMGTTSLQAQKIPEKTNKAIMLFQEGKLIEAKEQINIALQDPKDAGNEYSWFAKSFIYKELYKSVEVESKYSEYREVALDALLRSMEMDRDKSLLDEHKKAVSFLSRSYFNNAVELVKIMSESNIDESPKFYERFRQLSPLGMPELNLDAKDVEFYNAYGYKVLVLHDSLDLDNIAIMDKAIDAYKISLSRSPNDTSANYNLAVIHYNRGAKKVSKINYQTEIFELIAIQDECLKHFKAALPYMLKTYELDPRNMDSLKGLMAIYLAMNDDARSAEYKAELEQLIKSGN